jgi:hypothetical protein
MITAALQIVHHLILGESVVVNSYSMRRFSLLLSIPCCLLFSVFSRGRPPQVHSTIAVATFCLGSLFVSTDAFTLSIEGVCVGLTYAVANAALVIFTEEAMIQGGTDSILFQESVAPFRTVFSAIVTASMIAIEPLHKFSIHIGGYPLCLLVASAALDLVVSVSMTSLIASSSSVNFLVAQQFSELMMILIGQTLNPTRFTTFREAVLSFVGFCLAIPAQMMFLIVGDPKDRKATDEEPFQIGEQPSIDET